jgi:hypothetical protein
MPLSPEQDPLRSQEHATDLEETQARIDAFLREQPLQHSLQLLSSGQPDTTDTPYPENELPVLTDIVAYAATPEPERATPPPEEAQMLARMLAEGFRQRLRAEIPPLTEAALQVVIPEISRAIQEGLESIVQETLRDFIEKSARKKQ